MEHPIWYAAAAKNWKMLLKLLEFQNLNVDFRPKVTDNDSESTKLIKSWTALLLAVLHSNLEVVQALLQAGANPELKSFHGYCALSYAAKNDKKGPIIDLLIKNIKKDPNEKIFEVCEHLRKLAIELNLDQKDAILNLKGAKNLLSRVSASSIELKEQKIEFLRKLKSGFKKIAQKEEAK